MKKTLFTILLTLSTLEATNTEYRGFIYAKQSSFNSVHKSALKGQVEAQYQLALMFHYGKGVRQSAELARLWFTRAAKRGHHKAQSVLYRFYAAPKPYFLRKNSLRYSMNFRTYR
jgi:TPR repeat protein